MFIFSVPFNVCSGTNLRGVDLIEKCVCIVFYVRDGDEPTYFCWTTTYDA